MKQYNNSIKHFGFASFFLISIFISFVSYSQNGINYDELPELIAYSSESMPDKMGFKNYSGDVIVPPIYVMKHWEWGYEDLVAGEDCPGLGTFTCGLSRVYDNERGYGYIDYKGIEVIPCKYKTALPFNDGLAAVENDNGWGYIDITGKVIIPLVYDMATMHRYGYAFLGKHSTNSKDRTLYAIVNNRGEILTDFVYENVVGCPYFSEGLKIVKKDNKQICITPEGQTVFDIPSNMSVLAYFSNGLIPYIDAGDNKGRMGLIDNTGKIVLKPKYNHINCFFDNGLTIVSNVFYEDNQRKDLYGVIDKNFREIIPLKYKDLSLNGNKNQCFVAEDWNGKYGLIDLQGNIKIPFKFDFLSGFFNGYALVSQNEKRGFIDEKGEFVIPPIYDGATTFDENGYAIVQRGDLCTIIDIEQVPLVPYDKYERVYLQMERLGRLHAKSDVDVHIPVAEKVDDKTLVLVISNEKYSYMNVGNVMFAHNDGNGIVSYCKKSFGIPQSNIMECTDGTLSQIKSSISWLQQKSIVGDYDRAIVYYAGHGIPDYYNSKSYILPSDGNPLDMNTALALDDFYESLAKVKVKECIVFMDACFSGSNRQGRTLTEIRGINIKPALPEVKGNIIAFSACQGDEVSQPYASKHHGIFTYFLLKYLQSHHKDAT